MATETPYRNPVSTNTWGLQFYYRIKPLIPQQLRIWLRKATVKRKYKRCENIWPIDAQVALHPPGWPGWPEGKQFALVLTHDVEDSLGLTKCRALMDLEVAAGVRSCFNFVPERYATPAVLRNDITDNGFEIGVHGYNHDGKLFSSLPIFRRRAEHINRILHAWDAVGFRAPSMHHNLDWIRELDIEYDSSTFDTDPFEPQPDGVGTMFPFRVDGDGHRRGYIELPYTLPQDFTLFVLLGEQTPEVWKRKLDWIAIHGGMVLLNTHPDYINFTGRPALGDAYPVQHYKDLLDYIDKEYAGRFWNALPREVARYAASLPPPTIPRRRKRVAMVGYTYYENDNRVIRYAQTLTARGDAVEMVGLRTPGQPLQKRVGDVDVRSVQQRQRNEHSSWTYLWRLLRFLVRSSVDLTRHHRRQPYDVVHVHSVPDFEVFAAWWCKWRGARVILDIHDLVPEFYAGKFGTSKNGVIFRLLVWVERLSCTFADHVIVANHLWYDRLIERSVPAHKCSVILNYVDPALFRPQKIDRQDDRFVIIYPGSLQWHQGIDLVIRAFASIAEQVPKAELHIYGRGGEEPNLRHLSTELGMDERIHFKGTIPHTDVPKAIASANLGIVGKRSDSFGDEAYSTKIMEYMSQSVPCLVPRTRVDSYYFDDSVVHFFNPGDPEDMARGMLSLIQNPPACRQLVRNGLDYCRANGWDVRKGDYLDLVDLKPASTSKPGPVAPCPSSAQVTTVEAGAAT